MSSVARNLAQIASPLGPLAAGVLLGAYSSRVTLLVLGSIALALAAWTSVSPSIRNAPSLSELDELGRPATMEA